jgi:hypothetical protein
MSDDNIGPARVTDADRHLLIRALTHMRAVMVGKDRDHATKLLKQVIAELEIKSFVCPRCGSTSTNIGDVINRYCGECRQFFMQE